VFKDADWIHLSQNMVQRWVVADTVMKEFSVSIKGGGIYSLPEPLPPSQKLICSMSKLVS